ncbi:MAG: fluoride efflux transporter CrcB [Pseudomonadota bacterium]
MSEWLLVASGGAFGSCLRWLCSRKISTLHDPGFPWGILTVNIVGSFAIGFVYALMHNRLPLEHPARAFLIVGVLGGFTTFSAFSLDTLQLFSNGYVVRAMANIIATLIICLLATWIGLLSGRYLTAL